MRLIRIAALALAALALAGAAHAQPLRTPHVETDIVSSRAAIAPGERFSVALRQRIVPGWHTYWINAGDSGEPTQLTWRLPAGFEAGELRHPPPVTEQLLNVMTYVHKGEVLYPIEMRAPASLRAGETASLNAHVFYLVCSDICLTEEGDIALDLPVEAASRPDSNWAPRIEAAIASIPRDEGLAARITAGEPARLTVASDALAVAAGEGRVRNLGFFPFSPDAIRHVEPQNPSFGPRGLSFTLHPGVANDLGRTELAGVVAFDERTANGWTRRGIEIRATPGEALAGAAGRTAGVSPAKESSAGQGPAVQGDVTFPLAILFAFVGGLILNFMPCVLPVLAIKAVGLAQNAHGSARSNGLFYLAGVLATFLALAGLLIALRSAGAALGWAFQLQEPWLVAALALLFFAIGLNLLGAFEIGGAGNIGSSLAARGGNAGAFFTGALAVIVASPCTAPFMASAMGFAFASPPVTTLVVFVALALGFALPLTLLSFAPALRRLIPKPGPWMDRFKQVLAFPMFGAAVWLAWVLTVQQGALGALALLSLAVALAFAIMAARWGRVWTAIALVALAATGIVAWRPLAIAQPQTLVQSASTTTLPSEPWSPERLAALRAENRPILVNFTAAWCVTCQVNEAAALGSARVAEAFRAGNVAYLKGDWTNRNASIAAELARHGRAGVPLYLYYAPGAERPRILPQLLTENLLLQTVASGS